MPTCFSLQAVFSLISACETARVLTRSVTSFVTKGFFESFRFLIWRRRSFTSHGDPRIIHKQLRCIYTLCIYIYDTSIFPFLGSLTETTSTVRLCALVKQSDQDEGVHEMTAMSWKLGEGSTERSFTKVYIVEVALSLSLECKQTTLFSNSNRQQTLRARISSLIRAL